MYTRTSGNQPVAGLYKSCVACTQHFDKDRYVAMPATGGADAGSYEYTPCVAYTHHFGKVRYVICHVYWQLPVSLVVSYRHHLEQNQIVTVYVSASAKLIPVTDLNHGSGCGESA